MSLPRLSFSMLVCDPRASQSEIFNIGRGQTQTSKNKDTFSQFLLDAISLLDEQITKIYSQVIQACFILALWRNNFFKM